MMLPEAFLDRPIAHRGLHNARAGVIENSMSAFQAAMAHGYCIELDVQLSSDDHAIVFHDYHLDRLTGESGPIRERTAAELSQIRLRGTEDAKLPLADVLAEVRGRVPVLIEIKDQSLIYGPVDGVLERAVADALATYAGPAAVMSFNPHAIKAMAELAPDIPRGLVTERFTWLNVSDRATRRRMNAIADFEPTGSSFISHDVRNLPNPRVAEIRSAGNPILCWTVRSERKEARVRPYVDNITFESYLPQSAGPGG